MRINQMQRSRPSFLYRALLLLFIGASATTSATTLARMSVEQMSQVAPEIVRARCLGNSTSWDAGEIWTFTSFEIEEIWRGPATGNAARSQITIRLLGGRAGNLTSTVSGIPRFRSGEEVVLFLEPTRRGDFSIVSWEQGTFRVHHDPSTGLESATQDTASFATFDPVSRRFEATGISNVPIDVLRVRVSAALRNAPARKQ